MLGRTSVELVVFNSECRRFLSCRHHVPVSRAQQAHVGDGARGRGGAVRAHGGAGRGCPTLQVVRGEDQR